MDYQLVIFLSKRELMAVDITEDGGCEAVKFNGDECMNYSCAEDFADFAKRICAEYNVDEIEEMEAGGTIVNCGADTDSVIALLEALKGFKGIDAVDVKKLLPIIVQNRGLLKKNSRTVVKLLGNYFVVKCDEEGVATVSKNKVADDAVELGGSDFAFLYFYKSASTGGVNEEELAQFKRRLESEAEARVAAAEQAAVAEIAAIEAKYAGYKQIVEAMGAGKKNSDGRFADVGRGDIVKFGQYYQDGSGVKKDIEWQVLAVEAEHVLLIAKNGLYASRFDESTNKWANCSLRNWLNNTFLETAFNDEENQMIAKTKTGSNCSDKVFLLSVGEVNKYFANDMGRECKATAYAKLKGASLDGGNCYWWLRTPGTNKEVLLICNDVATVRTDGSVNTEGRYVRYTDNCVRPAIWVNR